MKIATFKRAESFVVMSISFIHSFALSTQQQPNNNHTTKHNKMAGNSGRVTKKAPAKKAGTKSTSSGSKALYSGTAQGTTQLPVARVKRIIKEDKDVQMVSNDAVFLISLATVRFFFSLCFPWRLLLE